MINNFAVIGAADLYTWKDIRNWAVSLRNTGYMGNVFLICYRISDDVIEQCNKYKIQCVLADEDDYGSAINHNANNRNTQSHQLRFYHAYQLLSSESYINTVVMTDVRDVIFQKDPIETYNKQFIEYNCISGGEFITYKNEPWGMENIILGYGKNIASNFELSHIANVGTLAGSAEFMKNLFLTIYLMGKNKYIPNDQSTFNILSHSLLSNSIHITNCNDAWAANLGTTLDPAKPYLHHKLIYEAPVFNSDGIVYDKTTNKEYTLVHQYDRIPELLSIYTKRYEGY